MMKCSVCGSKTDVVDSRATEKSVRRRRECRSCGKRFTTYETPAEAYRFTEIVGEFHNDMTKAIKLLDQNVDQFKDHQKDVEAAELHAEQEARGYVTRP